MKQILATFFVAAICAACTYPMSVVKVVPSDPVTRTGVAYHLPYTRFDVSVTRMVKACGPASITLATTVESAITDAAIDPTQAYTIDPNSMAGVFRVSSVKAEYAKGGLVKSLNASAEDRTVQILSAVGAGIVKVATLSGGVPVVNSGAAPACSESTLETLQALPQATRELKEASKELALAAHIYKAIQERVTALGGIVDESTRRALADARTRSDVAATSSAGLKAKLDKLKEGLSHTEKFQWPRNGSEFQDSYKSPANLMNLWKNPDFKGVLPEPGHVDLRLVSDARQPDLIPTPVSNKETVRGLPYRMPQPGHLLVCDSDCSPANQLAMVSAEVLQLGTHYYLPCQSQTFGSTSCTFTVNENGIPTSAGTESKVAAAENAASAFKELATQYSAVKEARRDAEKLAYEAETARLKAKAEYEKAIASPVAPTATQLLNEQTTLLKAYVDYYTAMKAYTDAKNAAAAL